MNALRWIPWVMLAATSFAEDESGELPEVGENEESGGLDSLVLPELGDLPDVPEFSGLDFDGWEDFDQNPVDPSILEVRRANLPPASSFLPSRALIPEKRRYTSFRFEGNRALSDVTLEKEISWALGEPLGVEETGRIGEQITRLYIASSYINSGASSVAPCEDDGVLLIKISEGTISNVVITPDSGREACVSCPKPGSGRLRDSYLIARVMGRPGEILSFDSLRNRLQILQKNPNIRRISAEIKPGILPGEAYVELGAEREDSWGAGMEFHNHLPPSVGSEQLDLWLFHSNVLGMSDTFSLRYGVFGGGFDEPSFAAADNVQLDYSIPIRRDDTTLGLYFKTQGYTIIEEPFNDLLIQGETTGYGLTLRRPILRDLENELWWSLSVGKKDSSTELLGVPFSVSPGYIDGELSLTVVGASLEWIRRGTSRVTSLNLELLAGLDALGATRASGEVDSEFVALRMNSQYLHQLNSESHLLALRASAQVAEGPLPSPEQWTLGGFQSVRGYRQNEIVDDIGFALGIEYRLPLSKGENYQINLVPFVDGGVAARYDWSESRSLVSAGVGLTATYGDWLRGEVFFGIPISRSENKGDDLQDHGIHFQFTAGKF